MIRSNPQNGKQLFNNELDLANKNYDVCLVTLTFYPDHEATAKLMFDLAIDLSEKGLNVAVLTQNRSYKNPRTLFPSFEQFGKCDVFRVETPSLQKNRGLSKMIMYLIFAKKVSNLMPIIKADVFIAVFPPFFAAFKTLKACISVKKPFVIILHDLHPDTAILRNQISKWHPLALLLKRQTRTLMQKSIKIVTLGRDVNEYLKKEYLVPEDRMIYIPNWGRPMPHTPAVPSDEDAPFTVLYAGNFGEASDFSTLLKAAGKIQALDRKISFLLVGNGRKRAELEDYAKKEKIDNVKFSNFVPEEEYLELLRQASVCIVTLRESSKGMSVPSKLYYYLCAGKPVLAIVPENSEVWLAIKEDEFGEVCQNNNVDCVVKGLLKLKNNPDYYNSVCEKARKAFETKYSKNICTEKYFELIQTIRGAENN